MGAARLAYFVSKDVGNGKGVTLDTHTHKKVTGSPGAHSRGLSWFPWHKASTCRGIATLLEWDASLTNA